MNVFTRVIAEGELGEEPELDADKFVIDDNIGEAIHIHYRNLRLEYSVDDFVHFADECIDAAEEL